MLKKYNIVCIGTSDWIGPWGVLQQLMTRFAKENRVLFIEYQFHFLYFFYQPTLFVKKSPRRRILREVAKNIFVFTPPYTLPFNYLFRFVNKINQKFLSKIINELTSQLSFNGYILWSATPSSVDLLEHLRDKKMFIYHCANDITAQKINIFRKIRALTMEREAIRKADIVFSHTQDLEEKYAALNPNTFYLPSGVDYEYFRCVLESNAQEKDDLKGIERPRIGIVGYFDDFVYDVELLENIIMRKDKYSFVFVGPLSSNSKRMKALNKYKNVYFIGLKTYKEIPFYLNSFDLCLLPYRKNGTAFTASPLKFYEYLASGKPVVTSPIKDILKYKDFVKVSHNLDEFCSDIDEALVGDARGNFERRIELAAQNSWEKRIERVCEIIKAIK